MSSQWVDAYELDGVKRPVLLDLDQDRRWKPRRPSIARLFAELFNPDRPKPSAAERDFVASLYSIPGRIAQVEPDENIDWLEYEDETPGRWFVRSLPLRLFRTSDGTFLMEVRIGNRAFGNSLRTYFRIVTREQATVWLKHEGYGVVEFDAPGVADSSPQTAEQADDWPDHVTLSQAAAMVHRSKRSLEKLITSGEFPTADIEGGGGKAGYWRWSQLRPYLIEKFGLKLPDTFPANFHPDRKPPVANRQPPKTAEKPIPRFYDPRVCPKPFGGTRDDRTGHPHARNRSRRFGAVPNSGPIALNPREHHRSGDLRFAKQGRRTLYRGSWVLEWLESSAGSDRREAARAS